MCVCVYAFGLSGMLFAVILRCHSSLPMIGNCFVVFNFAAVHIGSLKVMW